MDEIEKRGRHFAYMVRESRDMTNARQGWSSLGLSGPAAGKKTHGPPQWITLCCWEKEEKGEGGGGERERERDLIICCKKNEHASQRANFEARRFLWLRCVALFRALTLDSVYGKFISKNVKNAFSLYMVTSFICRYTFIHYFSVIGIKRDGKRRCVCVCV